MRSNKPREKPTRRGTRRHQPWYRLGLPFLLAHQRAFITSWQKLCYAPLSSLMTMLVIAIALSLPTAALVVLNNGRHLVSEWDGGSQISVYLKKETSASNIAAFTRRLESLAQVRDVIYISAEDALAEFGRDAGFADALALLDENPLPPVLVVRLHHDADRGADRGAQAQQLHDQIKVMPEVDRVDIDMEWIHRLGYLLEAVQRVGLAVALLMALGVMLIVGNTIRLDILNHQIEIVIIKRVGGTHAFIRRPFLYAGVFCGLGGSMMAWLLVEVGIALINGPARQLAGSFQSTFSFYGLGWQGGMILVICGVLLGLVGSWVAVTHHLRQVEPA